jgi:hypothetical protein
VDVGAHILILLGFVIYPGSTKSVSTRPSTRQIKYIMFYTFGEPSILGRVAHHESNATKA